MAMTTQKISIVTPTCNSQAYIGETIQSVLSQRGDFEIEYIIVDAASTDETLAIVKRYQSVLSSGSYPVLCRKVEMKLVSEKDEGMYDAINKGFGFASGDILAWINSDDIYLPGAFNTVAKVFGKYPDINWLKGNTSYITEDSAIYKTFGCNLYAREWIEKGVYGRSAHFIEQETVFWRKNIWNQIGGIDASMKLAGDYYLWYRFSRLTPLVSVNTSFSCFRKVKGQLSSNINAYYDEERRVVAAEPWLDSRVRGLFRRITAQTPLLKWLPEIVLIFLYKLFFGNHKYSAVNVYPDGNIERVEGNYFSVASKLGKR